MVLSDAQRQGLVPRNVAESVDTVAVRTRRSTLSPRPKFAACWQVWPTTASGMRGSWRCPDCAAGRSPAFRWSDVDLGAKTIAIAITNSKMSAGGWRTIRSQRPRGAVCRCPLGW